MKAKILTRINAFIALLLTILGIGGGCRTKYGIPEPEPRAEYGCPYATFEAKGKVTDENAQAVENIRVRIRNKYGDELPYIYTDENGEYNTGTLEGVFEGVFPPDSVDIIVTDTADIYAPDSVRIKVEYDKSKVSKDDHWNAGAGSVYQDFQLKKND